MVMRREGIRKASTLLLLITLPIVCVLLSATLLFTGEIFDTFSRLEDYLRLNSDLKRSKGEILFYADVGYLGGLAEGETKVVVMISIPESELRFHRSEESYFAKYRVSLYWKDLDSGEAQEKVWDKQFNRLEGIAEENAIHTVKTDLSLRKGRYKIEIEVEDRNAHRYGQVPFEVDVPELIGDTPSLSTLFLHTNTSKAGEKCEEVSLDDFDLKALGLYRYSKDKVAYFVQVYGVDIDSVGSMLLKISVIDPSGVEKWSEERILSGASKRCTLVGGVGIERLDLGEYRIKVSLLDSAGTTISSREKPFYVSSSDRWIEDHFEFAIERLQYIASRSEMKELRSSTPDQRLERWREFWEKRDPIPATPVNESLVKYYRRLQYVNRNFSTHIEEGWKTDRGRVYLSLGPPDESIVRESLGIFGKWEIWVYDQSLGVRAVLYFEDRGFTDDYRLVNPGAFIRAKTRTE